MRTIAKIFLEYAASLLVVAIALLLAFAALKLSPYGSRLVAALEHNVVIQRGEGAVYVDSFAMGRTFKPNATLQYTHHPSRTELRTQINGDGFNDRVHLISSPSDKIVLLGDELMEGLELPESERLPHLLETAYAKIPGRKETEFLNFSIRGWGQTHQAGCLEEVALRYKPKEAWVFFSPVRAFARNSALVTRDPPLSPLVLDSRVLHGFPSPPLALLDQKAALYSPDMWAAATQALTRWEKDFFPEFYEAEPSPLWQRIEADTHASLSRLLNIAASKGTKIKLIYLKEENEAPNSAGLERLRRSLAGRADLCVAPGANPYRRQAQEPRKALQDFSKALENCFSL